MHITLHCGGMPFNGRTALTQSLGGSESAAYYLARELAERGHRVTLFTTSDEEGVWEGVRYVYAGEPSQEAPLGDRFHFYAIQTPTDVLVIQRHPQAFRENWNAKVCLWWLHDLALKRNTGAALHQLWNVDGVLAVSEFHRRQVIDTWGVNPRAVHVQPNGVDIAQHKTSCFDEGDKDFREWVTDALAESNGDDGKGKIRLLYASRPERGLEYHLREGGIMERLAETRPDMHLYVCMYANIAPQMREYYEYLWSRIDALPNVTNLGAIPRVHMPRLMSRMNALVYPSEFEETSCMLAKEAMASGLPFIGSEVGALPETCAGSGSTLIPLQDGKCDEDAFVRVLEQFDADPDVAQAQYDAAPAHDWSEAALEFEATVSRCFDEAQSPGAMARHLMRVSDIHVLRRHLDGLGEEAFADPIVNRTAQEAVKLYEFAWTGKFAEHYDGYYANEAEKGAEGQVDDIDRIPRATQVARMLADLPEGSRVLDYGCAHGALTHGLARKFPHLHFIGVDIAERNVERARSIQAEHGIDNEFFHVGDVHGEMPVIEPVDAVIVAEVLEHVNDPVGTLDGLLHHYANEGARVILTTPYGPWEAINFESDHPWRAHLHHFERADLHEMWGHFPEFNVICVPAGETDWGDQVGSYVTTFTHDAALCPGEIDYERKLAQQAPRGTVSLCMLACHEGENIRRCLDSATGVVDEVIIALDPKATDKTKRAIAEFVDERPMWPTVTVFEGESPIDIGFDEARNATIERAHGDWILWMDGDEFLSHPQKLVKYLKRNAYEGLGLQHHHLAADPPGLLKTDYPVRLFRNDRGVRFYGVVHEHPEVELNEGVGHVMVVPDVGLIHDGYTSETVRRGRFERNIELLVRDREKYPERRLGKMLWLRDLAQMCRYEMERNGGQITPPMVQRAYEGIALWEDLLESGETRMAIETLQWYSHLVRLTGDGFDAGFVLDTSKQRNGVNMEKAPEIVGTFQSREHFERLLGAKLRERTDGYESPYY